MKSSVSFAAGAVLALGFALAVVQPALATTGSAAIKMCEVNKNCTWSISVSGIIHLYVYDISWDGFNVVECASETGSCKVVVRKQQTNRLDTVGATIVQGNLGDSGDGQGDGGQHKGNVHIPDRATGVTGNNGGGATMP